VSPEITTVVIILAVAAGVIGLKWYANNGNGGQKIRREIVAILAFAFLFSVSVLLSTLI
jgi:hypothetical protein